MMMIAESNRGPRSSRRNPGQRLGWALVGLALAGFSGPASTTRAQSECDDWTRKSDMPTPRLACRAAVAD